MADVVLRLNLDSEEVELTVDGEVALASGQDVFVSWVGAYNEKHPLEPVVIETVVPEKIVEPEEPVKETTDETTSTED